MNPIEKIRDGLGPKGSRWHKGGWTNGAGRFCLVAAADRLPGLDTYKIAHDQLGPVIRDQFPERVIGADAVPTFNDHPDTTWADVELVLDKASLRWEESQAES